MGTHAHKPRHDKPPGPQSGHVNDDAERPLVPGARPGVKSRVAQAQERLRERGEIR